MYPYDMYIYIYIFIHTDASTTPLSHGWLVVHAFARHISTPTFLAAEPMRGARAWHRRGSSEETEVLDVRGTATLRGS